MLLLKGVKLLRHLGDRVLGRTAAVDIIDPVVNKVIISAGTLIEEAHVEAIEMTSVDEVLIRSVLTCETKGWNLF